MAELAPVEWPRTPLRHFNETFLKLDSGWLFVRHSAIQPGRATVVCIHGLGDSGLAFSEAFDSPELAAFNLVAVDLLGFGRSSAAIDGDYSFKSQAERIWWALDQLGINTVTLVGHSMGGDLATLMASWDENGRVKALVNVEGNLTCNDLFISSKAAAAADRGQFLKWLYEDLAEATVLERWGERWPSCRRYFASLMFCHPEAFLDSARELVRRNGLSPDARTSEVGALFRSLDIPKVFCWGTESLADATQQLLATAEIPNQKFADAFHWIMIDQPSELYSFLRSFCEEHEIG